MSLLSPSTILDTPELSLSPSASLVDSLNAVSALPMALEDHLRVGSIALLCQNSRTRTSIRCVRPDHCNGNSLRFENTSNPVLVLVRQAIEAPEKIETCLVAWVTSHRKTSLASFTENSEQTLYGRQFIAIEHGSPQNCIDMLRLSHGKLNKQSYVVADHIWEVPVSMVQNYYTRGGTSSSTRLQEASYQYLMQKLDMVAQEYEPEPTTQLQSFPHPEPDFTEPEHVAPPQLEYEYATINYGYNYEETHHQDIHQYMIVHHGVVDLAHLRAAPIPRRVSNLISFPALPPSPSKSHVNIPNMSSRTNCFDENSPLLPTPATFGSRRRSNRCDKRQVWLGVMTIFLVLGWILFLSTFQGSLSPDDLWSGNMAGH